MAKKSTALTAPGPAGLSYYDRQQLATIFDQIEKDLGGRGAVLESLLTAPETPETVALIGLLADPSSDTIRLSHLLKAGGVTLPQLLQSLTQAGFARAFLKSVQVIAAKTPAVVDDVLTRAAPHYLPCLSCEGTGTVAGETPDAAPTPCEACKGTGTTLILPDLDRQKLALDLARMLPTKAAIVQNFDHRKQLGSGSIEGMTALIKATDDLLRGARPAPRSRGAEAADALADPADIIDGSVVPSVTDGADGNDADPR